MINRFIFLILIILLFGCKSPFDKELQNLKPNELVDALNEVDSLGNCKKKWVKQKIYEYHTLLIKAKQEEEYESAEAIELFKETLRELYMIYCKNYDISVSKWQNLYNQNLRIKKLLVIDTSYIKRKEEDRIKIAIAFKPSPEIEKVSFEMSYSFWYNYKNSVEPDIKYSFKENYNLDGRVFRDTITIVSGNPSNFAFSNFVKQYNLIGKNNFIKSNKKDEYKIDYSSAKIKLLNGKKLSFTNMDDKPSDICIKKKNN